MRPSIDGNASRAMGDLIFHTYIKAYLQCLHLRDVVHWFIMYVYYTYTYISYF